MEYLRHNFAPERAGVQVLYVSTHKDDAAKADAPKKVAHRARH